jgi:hypothetical protein
MKLDPNVFKIAKNWMTASSDDVRSFKTYLRRLNPRFAQRAGEFRAFCHSEAPSPVAVIVAVEGHVETPEPELLSLQMHSDGRVLCSKKSFGHDCDEDCCF